MKYPLRVVSVERSLFEGDVEFMIANGAEGELGVLARHAPLMTILKPGPLRIQETFGGEEQVLFVGGGFLEVLPDRVTVLADVAEHAEEISVERAEEARRRAAEKLAGTLTTAEETEFQNALAMAEARLRLPRPGGDDIGARRVEQHLRGLRQMGAHITETDTEIIAEADRLRGRRIVFDLPTVTGTENILLAAVLAEGRTEIFNAAREPHVQDLCSLLSKMGARIEGIGSERVVVDGVRELNGAEHTVISDY